jgi:hypothetical protein
MLRFEDLRVRDNQNLDREFFNRRYRLIAESLAELDAQLARINTATDNLVSLGLVKVNEVLVPVLATVQAASENGFLVAPSATPLRLVVGLQTTFEVEDTSARSLFAPTPYCLISREGGGVEDWAVFRVDSYDRETGGLAGEIVAVNGTLGAAVQADWTISASAGLAPTIIEAAVTVTNTLALAQEAAQQAAQAAQTAEDVLANGPVSSVNGLSGPVAIGISDIPTLTEQLASKAAATHGHTIAQVADLHATLDALEAAITANGAVIASNQTAITAITQAVADLGQALPAIDGGTY